MCVDIVHECCVFLKEKHEKNLRGVKAEIFLKLIACYEGAI